MSFLCPDGDWQYCSRDLECACDIKCLFLCPGGDCQYCSRDADCVYDIERLVYRCSCQAGFTGDGITCTSIGKTTTCVFASVVAIKDESNAFLPLDDGYMY